MTSHTILVARMCDGGD